jgi:hypothetical protein
MKWTYLIAVLTVALVPSRAFAEDTDITLRGCVVRGLDKDTFALTQVSEVTKDDRSAIPPVAHGRRVVFWLDKDDKFKEHVAEMVEVKGKIEESKESEIELKPGHEKDGGLIAEFEGPGKDVRVPNSVIGDAIGTTGRTDADKKEDIKTWLLKVKVDDVKRVDGYCQPPAAR